MAIGTGATGDYLTRWLGHAKARVRARTYQGYEGLIRLYAVPSVGEILLQDLHPLHLQSLYTSLMNYRIPPISAGTVLNLHLVLTQAFGQAVGWGLLDRSPAAGAQPPRPRRPEPAVVSRRPIGLPDEGRPPRRDAAGVAAALLVLVTLSSTSVEGRGVSR